MMKFRQVDYDATPVTVTRRVSACLLSSARFTESMLDQIRQEMLLELDALVCTRRQSVEPVELPVREVEAFASEAEERRAATWPAWALRLWPPRKHKLRVRVTLDRAWLRNFYAQIPIPEGRREPTRRHIEVEAFRVEAGGGE